MAVRCEYCGTRTETFVSNLERLNFCRIHTPGKDPEKDCMSDYYKEKKYVQKEEQKNKSLFSQKEKQLQKEEVKLYDRNSAIKKLDELKQFLKNKRLNSL